MTDSSMKSKIEYAEDREIRLLYLERTGHPNLYGYNSIEYELAGRRTIKRTLEYERRRPELNLLISLREHLNAEARKGKDWRFVAELAEPRLRFDEHGVLMPVTVVLLVRQRTEREMWRRAKLQELTPSWWKSTCSFFAELTRRAPRCKMCNRKKSRCDMDLALFEQRRQERDESWVEPGYYERWQDEDMEQEWGRIKEAERRRGSDRQRKEESEQAEFRKQEKEQKQEEEEQKMKHSLLPGASD